MFNTARTSARTMLVAAGAAGFVALGAGISGADTLGGVTDGLPLNDLGSQVPASLTEGVSTPLGDLVKVEPGQLSAQPDVRRQSAPEQPLSGAVGDTVSTDTPVEAGEDNAANVGPLDLNTVTEGLPVGQASSSPLSGLLGGASPLGGLGGGTLPLSHASTTPLSASPLGGLGGGTDLLSGLGLGGGTLPLSHASTTPLSASPLGGLGGGTDLLSGLGLGGGTLPLSHASTTPLSASPLGGLGGGTDLLSGLGLGGGTLPLSHAEPSVPLSGSTEKVGATVDRLGSAVEQGTHEVGGNLNGLDATLPTPGEPLPLAAAMDGPVAPVNGQNTDLDLTGGAGDAVSDLVLSDDVMPMSAGSNPLPQPLGAAPTELLPVSEDALPVAGSEVAAATEMVTETARTTQLAPVGDSLGNDLVGVEGMPELGRPDVDAGALKDTLPGDLV
ncbi:hypothetical protein HNR06_002462 [Nocardiopsis arvandica]|uniref:Uncharacterized protein n=1 Tax=Nocardiopsis sinuspersici TaxID=501010 RepID=A0A7Y9XE27_9ACTN|nr:hypothetical protein [Nocardiopsis sinuspersici]NYH52873.1 hypothetical protein [Nocardiopsis sinuspersici]